MIYVLIGLAIGVIALVIWMLRGRSQPADGMTSFQRQIDALSPEARRPVVDQVQRAAKDDDDDESAPGKRDDA